MNVTSNYIKKCREATEIQKERINYSDLGSVFYNDDTKNFTIGNSPRYIWLPRQEDLQEMVAVKHGDWDCWICLTGEFNKFLDVYIESASDDESACLRETKEYKMPSMTELWLHFVMLKKFNKVWSIKEQNWIKLSKK